jgi:hypothetical protein
MIRANILKSSLHPKKIILRPICTYGTVPHKVANGTSRPWLNKRGVDSSRASIARDQILTQKVIKLGSWSFLVATVASH